jgi:hypothetical protein
MQNGPQTVALGVRLATRGGLAAAGFALAALGALTAAIAAFVLRRDAGADAGEAAALIRVASSGIAWSAGMALAFGASLRALHRDREDGVLGLMRARGASTADYMRGRVVGLVIALVLCVGGATLVAALATVLAAGASAALMHAAAGALAYSLAFSATVGPLALATLGGRSRVGGYLALLAVLVAPEILSRWTAELLPEPWFELTSIPAALAAVRAGVAMPSTKGVALARALAALAGVAAAATAVATSRVRSAEREGAP